MIIAVATDIHGDLSAAERFGACLPQADLALVSGDITNFGGRKEAEEVLARLAKRSKRMLAVPGNCDRPEVGAFLTEIGCNLDGRFVDIEGLCFLGLGGSLPCPGRTILEYSEEELAETLEAAYREMPQGSPFVLICHQPSYGTKLDRVFGGIHVGSKAVRKFIESRKPLACFCGHIHESTGTDRIGGTIMCNPGPLAGGRYTLAVWDGERISVKVEKTSE